MGFLLGKTMDEIDIANEYLDRTIKESTDSVLSEYEQSKKRLLDLMADDKPVHCKYCGEELIGYTSWFCKPEYDWSCATEYQREKEAQKRNMKVDND